MWRCPSWISVGAYTILRKQDPIQRFAVKLEDEGLLEEEEWRTLEEQSQGRIKEAFEKAQNQPDPKPESALEDVYA